MDTTDFVAQARKQRLAKGLVAMISYQPRPHIATDDANADFRRRVCRRFAQDFGHDDREWLCCLLKQETAFHEQLYELRENMYLCAWMVASLRHPDDALLLWRAKQANFSANLGLPSAILLIAGEIPIRKSLRRSKDAGAAAYLNWLEEEAAVPEAEVEQALETLKSGGW